MIIKLDLNHILLSQMFAGLDIFINKNDFIWKTLKISVISFYLKISLLQINEELINLFLRTEILV